MANILTRTTPRRLLNRGLSFVHFEKPGLRGFASASLLPHIHASEVGASQNADHVQQVNQHLKDRGIIKISLQFEDENSTYLEQLIRQLNKNHDHGLPITHSASRGWFWDVRPQPAALAAAATTNQARSETMNNFPWHTDCSYEESPPKYFALQVLRPDQCGGGTLSVLDSTRLMSLLSPAARNTLSKPEFRITVPPEFIKNENDTHIVSNVLWVDEKLGKAQLRFREDIIEPLTPRGETALRELQHVLESANTQQEVLNLTPDMLPRGSIVAMDNRRWLHARNIVRDPNRHLRRVRWDARPFNAM
ncbi:hypothetical protein N7462_000588 [Penicillium macrosclerotiorum]|uniref:uncharacterized protein n=1 Tax=Penicillium macrosclerotiorum TaxID=303699 RepID=UPI002548649F|nr:uncharacterized protein N7462_000588 [Penicillium macrosclerotiorum]KAJ5698583.1 hypothetical protein N7462_000588 [Penicillium macrosclerotiorum]